jgi:hypothetical protein
MIAQDSSQSAPPAGGVTRLNAEGQPGAVPAAVVNPFQG